MKKLVIVFILTFSQIVNASCDKPVSYLAESEKAPCSGYLFTPEKELEVRLKVSSYDKLDELTKKQDELINILNERINNNQKQIILYEEKLSNQSNSEFYQKVLFFALGVLTTTIIANTVIHNVR